MAFSPDTDCLITDLLELEKTTFEMIVFCSHQNNLSFLPEGHILKNQMVHMLQHNSVLSSTPID